MSSKKKHHDRYHGLENQGATCYLNSVLQVLFMTKDFREAVQRNVYGNHIDVQLASLFKTLKSETGRTVQVTNKLGIRNVGEQRDAAEHFEKILTLTSNEAAKIFRGELTHKTICSGCDDESDEVAAFWNLPLPLVNPTGDIFSVVEGIKEFFSDSHFQGDNQMYCDKCEDKSDATTKCMMTHHPEVLMLLLKRFEFSYQRMSFVKNNCDVTIPSSLRIPEDQIYELYAFVEHFGSLKGGHYTATIRSHSRDNKWYCFNDSSVTLLNNQPFHGDKSEKSRSAYLLFYKKKNTHSQEESTNKDHPSPNTESNKMPHEGFKDESMRKNTKTHDQEERDQYEGSGPKRRRKEDKSVDDAESELTKQRGDIKMSKTQKQTGDEWFKNEALGQKQGSLKFSNDKLEDSQLSKEQKITLNPAEKRVKENTVQENIKYDAENTTTKREDSLRDSQMYPNVENQDKFRDGSNRQNPKPTTPTTEKTSSLKFPKNELKDSPTHVVQKITAKPEGKRDRESNGNENIRRDGDNIRHDSESKKTRRGHLQTSHQYPNVGVEDPDKIRQGSVQPKPSSLPFPKDELKEPPIQNVQTITEKPKEKRDKRTNFKENIRHDAENIRHDGENKKTQRDDSLRTSHQYPNVSVENQDKISQRSVKPKKFKTDAPKAEKDVNKDRPITHKKNKDDNDEDNQIREEHTLSESGKSGSKKESKKKSSRLKTIKEFFSRKNKKTVEDSSSVTTKNKSEKGEKKKKASFFCIGKRSEKK